MKRLEIEITGSRQPFGGQAPKMKPEVATYQVPWEFDQLMNALDMWPQTVLEVGCFEGGTLWHWLQMARKVTAIDDAFRNADDWREWASESGATLHTIQGDSRHPDIIEAAREHGPYELIFIDADHTYQAVSADWDNYAPMLADGGCVALHDILERPGYGVSQLWAEIKALPDVRYIEIAKNATEPGNEGPCGIGIVWL